MGFIIEGATNKYQRAYTTKNYIYAHNKVLFFPIS